jgi:hypothetical protein
MRDRPNWYSETATDRSARRRHRFRSLRMWFVIAAIILGALAFNGGPFSRGTVCTTSTHLDTTGSTSAVRVSCHQSHGWLP